MSKLNDDVIERIRKAARENPDVTNRDLAKRFSVSPTTIGKALQNGAAKGGLKFPRGTHVKFPDGGHARTGVVIDDALDFPWRDHRKVALDPMPGGYLKEKTAVLVPAVDLREIKPTERAETARPREQVPLFARGDS
ncbi:MAG TPA: hypothetical protein VGE37_12755 [Archangium sp.]